MQNIFFYLLTDKYFFLFVLLGKFSDFKCFCSISVFVGDVAEHLRTK
jgi:hypothetical protein